MPALFQIKSSNKFNMKSKKIKAKKTFDPFKGYKATRKLQTRFFLSLLTFLAFVFAAFMLTDADSASICMPGLGSSTILASMMLIGDVGDVSDRLTHGSNIAYKVYLIDVNQIDQSVNFPVPNVNREVATLPMKNGEYMKYFEAHDIPAYTATGEKGDITTSGDNSLVLVMGGMRDQLLTFVEEHAGGKFIILFKEVGAEQWYIIGSYDRPMILQSFEAKNDKDGRYITFTFKRTSIDQYYKYVGDIVRAPAMVYTAGQTTLNISKTNNRYTIPNGEAATYAINAVSGLTANDKGRYITLEGTGTTYAATIADGSSFILEDGTTWIASAGSQITFRVMDSTTLVEVSGSRVQTA
jgi:hypothetical protein